MSLQHQLKKNYLNYLLSIILPALISSVSIPVIKRMLGPEQYGLFSIYNNGVQILAIALTGWITQSILRFSQSENHLTDIKTQAIKFTSISVAMASLPLFFFYFIRNEEFILSLLLLPILITSSFQLVLFSMAQASFLSRKILVSETLRTGIFLLLAIFLVYTIKSSGIYPMIFSVIIAWSVSIFYLIKNLNKHFSTTQLKTESLIKNSFGKKFLSYGLPLSCWFVFANLLTYTDKYLMARHWGHEVQGNYQALFDILFRGISMAVSPIMMMLLPLLSKEYESGNRENEIGRAHV